ncbi:hypothetical protein E2C01_021927 [Portunus trituberculatus]|uniref:Uncharacterized protein n=1 Tax=Portunus trituberculatus TaxID=210409 RepID=A0A5B7E4P7_PORTR|nr:hypothetical protein [Portunus trituberculatus]
MAEVAVLALTEASVDKEKTDAHIFWQQKSGHKELLVLPFPSSFKLVWSVCMLWPSQCGAEAGAGDSQPCLGSPCSSEDACAGEVSPTAVSFKVTSGNSKLLCPSQSLLV